jgi:hypothetical protein
MSPYNLFNASTGEEELALAARIQTQFRDRHCVFTNEDFRFVVIETCYPFNAIVQSDGNNEEGADAASRQLTVRQFLASDGFIHGFKKRHKFNSRGSLHSAACISDPDRQRGWVDDVKTLLRSPPPLHELVLNCARPLWIVAIPKMPSIGHSERGWSTKVAT